MLKKEGKFRMMGSRFVRKFNSGQQGFSILEVVLAVGLAVLILSALVSLGVTATKNSTFSRDQTQATKLARETMERVRAFRDQKGLSALKMQCPQLVTTFCQISPVLTVVQGKETLTGTPFTRYFQQNGTCPAAGGGEIVPITVTVEWTDGGGKHNAQLQSCFTSWQ